MYCTKQIVGKNLSIVAQRWTLSESHLLRLYLCISLNGTNPELPGTESPLKHTQSQFEKIIIEIEYDWSK